MYYTVSELYFAIIYAMAKKDIREFDSAYLAKMDVALWKAYYNHQFFKMFRLIIAAAYRSMGPNIFFTVAYAYYSSMAAVVFRKTKGHETDASNARILRYLEKFYALVSKKSAEPFDYKLAAKVELEWWFVDRYPERYKETRADIFARHREIFYAVPQDHLREYAVKRAEGMELLADYHHDITYQVDWDKMERLLAESYQALYAGLHQNT